LSFDDLAAKCKRIAVAVSQRGKELVAAPQTAGTQRPS
jgi:hypothetical protein